MRAVLIILGVGVVILIAVVLLRRTTQADTVIQQAPSNKWDFFSDLTTTAVNLIPSLASVQGGTTTHQDKTTPLSSNNNNEVLFV